ncbi:MAG: hypothetical protein DRZ79_00730 [Candidatus Cloacimonadota bacterium]|nr:MAG: hypothetical protein DRZ79_00730 [Candidatus Cloacimonadota bacterium]
MAEKKNKKTTSKNKEYIEFLSKVNLFENLSLFEKRNLAEYFYVRKYKAGEIVFKKGYPNVVFYILKDGELKVYIENAEIRRIKPTEYIGEIGLFIDVERTASVSAVTDSVLLGISKKDLEKFTLKFPRAGEDILYKLLKILSENIFKMNKDLPETDNKKSANLLLQQILHDGLQKPTGKKSKKIDNITSILNEEIIEKFVENDRTSSSGNSGNKNGEPFQDDLLKKIRSSLEKRTKFNFRLNVKVLYKLGKILSNSIIEMNKKFEKQENEVL